MENKRTGEKKKEKERQAHIIKSNKLMLKYGITII